VGKKEKRNADNGKAFKRVHRLKSQKGRGGRGPYKPTEPEGEPGLHLRKKKKRGNPVRKRVRESRDRSGERARDRGYNLLGGNDKGGCNIRTGRRLRQGMGTRKSFNDGAMRYLGERKLGRRSNPKKNESRDPHKKGPKRRGGNSENPA